MDIEFSPCARVQRSDAPARNDCGLAAGAKARRDGRPVEKRVCSNSHPATVHRECAGRFLAERTMGILWRHSSVNLVKPRAVAPAAAWLFRAGAPESSFG
ncbi:MAG TPA: hypothetical protein VIL42_08460 [Sphingomicrobium sp.]